MLHLHPLPFVRRSALIMLWIIACSLFCRAQLPVFRNYNTEDGLPSSETYCIVQDSRGYIYIGTDRGLSRFDGRHFETLTTKDGLVNNAIFNLIEHEGKIWYYTYSSLVGYLKQDKAYPYRYNKQIGSIMNSGLRSDILFDKNGALCINKGWPYSSELIRITADGRMDRSLGTSRHSAWLDIFITANRRWIRSGSDTAKHFNLRSWETGVLLGSYDLPDDRRKSPIFLICGHQKDSTVLLLYRDVYRLQNGKCRRIITCPASVLYMLVDQQENIWLGYLNQGLDLYRKADNYTRPVRLLRNQSISGILQDREGALWFTTLENGVYYLPPRFLSAYDTRTGLSAAKVTQAGLLGEEIAVKQSDFTLSMTRSDMSGKWYQPLPEKGFTYTLIDNDARILYFTGNSNRVRPGKAQHQFVYIPISRLLSTGKHVWGVWDNHLVRFDRYGRKRITLPAEVPYTISSYELTGDSLLLGTFDGLFLYAGDSLQRLKLEGKNFKERMSDIRELDKDHLVVATSGRGLMVLHKKSLRLVRHITDAEGLRHMICNVVRCDDSGVVWVGTNRGLYKIEHILEKARTRIRWADIHEGINSNEINDICVAGPNLWLATARGVSIFPRDRKLGFRDSIPVLIQQLRVNGSARNLSSMAALSYDENNVSIHFAGINYQYADVLQYRFRLLGDGKEAWNHTADPVVNYNSLPPGDYIFEYGAMAPNQYGKIYTASFRFSITPPFWQSWWFILLLVLLGIYGIGLFIHYRTRAIRRQEQLRTDLSIYRDKALRDQMSPHFIYNSLNTIQNYILKHDTDMSVSFLSKFSKLMRQTFNNTVEETITVQQDLEALQLYTEMERMRFPGKLRIHLPDQLPEQLKQAMVPPLLLQPFVENAILHGLLPRNAPGQVWLTIEQENDSLRISIKDDGIGRQASARIRNKKKTFLNREDPRRKERKHTGTTITIARIAQAWEQMPARSRFHITDLYHTDGSPAGTFIQFYLPLHYD